MYGVTYVLMMRVPVFADNPVREYLGGSWQRRQDFGQGVNIEPFLIHIGEAKPVCFLNLQEFTGLSKLPTALGSHTIGIAVGDTDHGPGTASSRQHECAKPNGLVIGMGGNNEVVFVFGHFCLGQSYYRDMDVKRCQTTEELSERAYQWCENRIQKCAARSIYVPAGQTPNQLYRMWNERRPAFLEGVSFLQIDDVLNGSAAGMFRRDLLDKLAQYNSAFHPIEDGSEQADLAILGFGVNGHIAFHEPTLPLNLYSACVQLDDVTKKTIGIFGGQVWGVTYGLRAYLQTKAILLMVSGERKAPMFRRFMAESETFSATGLKRHQDLTVLVDFEY